MKKIQELQLKALDVLGAQVAKIDGELDNLRNAKNEFDIEAKLYFIRLLSRKLEQEADEIHVEMHRTNSIPKELHDDACLHGIDLSEVKS